MYNILAGLKEYFRRQEIVTDNVIFRLHYIFTTVLLIAFSLLVTATQVNVFFFSTVDLCFLKTQFVIAVCRKSDSVHQ
jgi:hypothetical protein